MNRMRLLALALVVTSLACSHSGLGKGKSNSETEHYSKNIGNIYIGNQEYLDSLENINNNDVLILDMRDDEHDPDVKIFDSYKINDKVNMKRILNYLIEYEQDNPTEWDRSFDSMEYEWLVHNFAYFINYRVDRTKDVDFNNKDEEKYQKKLVRIKE